MLRPLSPHRLTLLGIAALPLLPGGVVAAGDTLKQWREPADTLEHVMHAAGPAYTVLVSGPQVQGTGAFHLAHPDPTLPQRITLNPAISVAADTTLFFESRLGWATPVQIARAEVSTDNGANWTVVWSRAGTGDAGQGAYERVAVPLAAYAGRSVHIRFNYSWVFGSYYQQTETAFGWLIDDIQIGATYEVEPVAYSIGEPTALEQQMLEFINRARADAAAEAIRLRDTDDPDVVAAMAFFNVDKALLVAQFGQLPRHLPPLAPNARLIAAARLHSQDMLLNNFQDHYSSSNPPPPNRPGDPLGIRLQRQGYSLSRAAENVFSFARSAWHAYAAFNIDWGNGGNGTIGGMQNPPGHRLVIHGPDFREIGIGIIEGSGASVGPMLVTQDFANEDGRDRPFLTGVAWEDRNGNGFYDPGEGIGGMVVQVPGERFYAVTASAGGYAVPVSADGTYIVQFSGEGLPTWTTLVTVQNGNSVKLDYRLDQIPADPGQVVPARLEPIPGQPGQLRLTVFSGGRAPVLQSSTDLREWTWRLDVQPAPGVGGSFHFDLACPPTCSLFLRALVP